VLVGAPSLGPWLIVAFAVFVVALLPVLGLTPFNVQMISTVTDRYLYLAMLAPALAVAFLMREPCSRGRVACIFATVVSSPSASAATSAPALAR
jgi:hypothetical protein